MRKLTMEEAKNEPLMEPFVALELNPARLAALPGKFLNPKTGKFELTYQQVMERGQ